MQYATPKTENSSLSFDQKCEPILPKANLVSRSALYALHSPCTASDARPATTPQDARSATPSLPVAENNGLPFEKMRKAWEKLEKSEPTKHRTLHYDFYHQFLDEMIKEACGWEAGPSGQWQPKQSPPPPPGEMVPPNPYRDNYPPPPPPALSPPPSRELVGARRARARPQRAALPMLPLHLRSRTDGWQAAAIPIEGHTLREGVGLASRNGTQPLRESSTPSLLAPSEPLLLAPSPPSPTPLPPLPLLSSMRSPHVGLMLALGLVIACVCICAFALCAVVARKWAGGARLGLSHSEHCRMRSPTRVSCCMQSRRV